MTDCDCVETGEENSIVFLQGDCRKMLGKLEENSIDSVVTDPPYALVGVSRGGSSQPGDLTTPYGRSGPSKKRGFMGKEWDSELPPVETWQEVLRVLKPGGHLLTFGGTRTHHRLWCAVEDAGFEIRDTLMWLYGTGFPKSLNVSKAIDKAAGAKPATDAARQWEGWGTALKPAWEPILLARKPLIGTVATNVQAHGTGALNVDGCRISSPEILCGGGGKLWSHYRDGNEDKAHPQVNAGKGRWPANLVLDEEAAAMLDVQSGEHPSCNSPSQAKPHSKYRPGQGKYQPQGPIYPGDSGGASRFFYCAKASRKERGEGNNHPTVKPLALMRWLVRLITPPGGKVLDPFIGSGTTALAAKEEGFSCVGIDISEEYLEIARQRCGNGGCKHA